MRTNSLKQKHAPTLECDSVPARISAQTPRARRCPSTAADGTMPPVNGGRPGGSRPTLLARATQTLYGKAVQVARGYSVLGGVSPFSGAGADVTTDAAGEITAAAAAAVGAAATPSLPAGALATEMLSADPLIVCVDLTHCLWGFWG